jgi:apolipoprotein D and lipocalin family protein
MHAHALLVLLALLPFFISAKQCPIPPVFQNYTALSYEGFWYEIGKVQTAGGAFFQRGCQCTYLNATSTSISPRSVSTDFVIENGCRKGSPSGKLSVAKTYLVDETAPGQYTEEVIKGVKAVKYNVIHVDETFAVEFDCGVSFGILNYCLHVLAKVPEVDAGRVNEIVTWANGTLNGFLTLPFAFTPQSGCW